MTYLITYEYNGNRVAFYASFFNEDEFNASLKMIVFDLKSKRFYDGREWIKIKNEEI